MNNVSGGNSLQRIVIVGGGFAGINLARKLFDNKYYEVLLIDKNNYNYFTPFLYQVATSFLDPSSISYPFRKLFRNTGINFRMSEVVRVNAENNTIELNDGIISYDHLVLAAGTRSNFFGNDIIRKNAIALKGIDDALFMRNHLMKQLETAAKEPDPVVREQLLNIVVVGGGPTGVEVVGMLAEMKKYILPKDFPELAGAPGGLYLVDGQPRLMTTMSDKTSSETAKVLDTFGVKVILKMRVLNYEDGLVTLSNGQTIRTASLIWAAGVTANKFDGIPETSIGRGERMLTDTYNKVTGFNNVWAIGDNSIQLTDPAYPAGHPQLAQPAIQQGATLAKNFLRLAKGKPMQPFIYFDRGDMAIVGRHHAVADLFKHKLHLKGFFALFTWLFIHVISLVNYSNKIKTIFSWTIAYLTRDQALRMIFRSGNRNS
jgi:NADH dehydrogenase